MKEPEWRRSGKLARQSRRRIYRERFIFLWKPVSGSRNRPDALPRILYSKADSINAEDSKEEEDILISCYADTRIALTISATAARSGPVRLRSVHLLRQSAHAAKETESNISETLRKKHPLNQARVFIGEQFARIASAIKP